MSSSIAEFRAKLKANALIPVTIPGTDLVIDCRRPELLNMVSSGFLAWPALRRVQEAIAERSRDTVIDERPQPTTLEKARAFVDFLAEMVCAAAVQPRVAGFAAPRGRSLQGPGW